MLPAIPRTTGSSRSEEHTSELQSQLHLVCRLLLEKKIRSEEHTSELQSRLHLVCRLLLEKHFGAVALGPCHISALKDCLRRGRVPCTICERTIFFNVDPRPRLWQSILAWRYSW